jgi:hypothetical protein
MPFIEQEAKEEIKIIEGKKTKVITPEVEITLTNTQTGQEYMSDAEADADVNDSNTDTKREHIRRDVHVKVAQINIGAKSKEL